MENCARAADTAPSAGFPFACEFGMHPVSTCPPIRPTLLKNSGAARPNGDTARPTCARPALITDATEAEVESIEGNNCWMLADSRVVSVPRTSDFGGWFQPRKPASSSQDSIESRLKV